MSNSTEIPSVPRKLTRAPGRGNTVEQARSGTLRLACLLVICVMLLQGCDFLKSLGTDISDAIAELCGDHVFVATKFEDTRDGECTAEDCSLYDAVSVANFCSGTVRLSPGTYTVTTVDRDSLFSSIGWRAFPSIHGSVVIEGNGATIERRSSDRDEWFRFFVVLGSGNLTLDNVTLRNGFARGSGTTGDLTSLYKYGGAIVIGGGARVTLINATLADNRANSYGGAIFNKGELEIREQSVLRNNSSANRGGGAIYNSDSGRFDLDEGVAPDDARPARVTIEESTLASNHSGEKGGAVKNRGELTIRRSTIRQNTASSGAAIDNEGSLSVVASTLSGNEAGSNGGAINNNSDSPGNLIKSSTFHDNSAPGGGAVWHQLGRLQIKDSTLYENRVTLDAPRIGGIISTDSADLWLSNTIIARNVGGDCGITGSVTAMGANLDSDGRCGFALTADPRLQPLGAYGGATRTLMPRAGSPVINAGTMCEPTDQRGLPRPAAAGCDIGAVEIQPGED